MRVRLIPLAAVLLTACSTTQLPISPHRIDVQQGNLIDQEALEKLKPGLTRSQVRFLLGTPLVMDPFRDDRWDYVYNYRSAGKLTAQNRLTLFFDRDVLSRIETSGMDQATAVTAPGATPGRSGPIQPAPATQAVPESQPQNPPLAAAASTEPPATDKQPAQQPAVASPPAAFQVSQAAPQAATQTAASDKSKKPLKSSRGAATPGVQSRVPTSVVPPLEPTPSKPVSKQLKNAPPQPVALRNDTDAGGLKPDAMPDNAQTAAVSDAEAPVLAAVKAWAKAWSDRDEDGYLAAYAANFKPTGGFDKAEWERRRRLLLNLSKNIEVRVESPVVEFPAAGRALITFNQYYRSATYRDTVVKQLLMGLQEGHWLILEERVLPIISHGKKKK